MRLTDFEALTSDCHGTLIDWESGKAGILHTAESLFHDHGPANALGLANCGIHRRHATGGFGATMDPGAVPCTDFRFESLAALAEAHRAAGATP